MRTAFLARAALAALVVLVPAAAMPQTPQQPPALALPPQLNLDLGGGPNDRSGASARTLFQQTQGTVNGMLGAVGRPSGLATLDTQGQIPIAQIPAVGVLPSATTKLTVGNITGTTIYLGYYITDRTCQVDQTANINAALALAPAGAEVVLPPGCIRTSNTILVQGLWLRGSGRGSTATELRYSIATGAAAKMMGDGARVSDILFTNPVSNSTAVAVQLADGLQNPRGQMVDHVRAVGFQDQLDVQSGEFWSATYLDFYNATRYGVRIRNGVHPDSGDGVIAASTIYADAPIGDTAIRIESGGGLKVIATKTLQFNHSLVLAVADGANTSILMVDGSNSFENPYSSEAVHLGRIEGGTTGLYGHINIQAQLTGAVGVYPGVENVVLGTLTRNAPYGIVIQGGDNINVLPGTTFKGVDQALVIQDPATNVNVGNFLCGGCRIKILDQRTSGTGRIDIDEVRPLNLPAPFSSAAFTVPFEVQLAPARGLLLHVEVEGLMSNAGPVNTVADVLFSHNGNGVLAPVPVHPQVDSAIPIKLQYDTTSVPGSVRVGIRVPSAYTTSTMFGSVTLKADGRVNSLKVLQ